MAITSRQTIEAGAMYLLVADVPEEASSEILDNIDGTPGETDTELTVSDASVIAPNVWETSTGEIGDPPVIDVLTLTGIIGSPTGDGAGGEIMLCYSRTDADETIDVIRGFNDSSLYRGYNDSQFNSDIADGAEIQNLGSFTFPSLTDIIITEGDVEYSETQGTFQTGDNSGPGFSFTSEAASVQLTVSLAKNTLPYTLKTLGFTAQTDGNTNPTKMNYIQHANMAPAGYKQPGKFIVAVPVTDLIGKESVEIDGTDYLDLSRAIVMPYAQLSLELNKTFSNSGQTNVSLTLTAAVDPVTKTSAWKGGFKDLFRIGPTV